MEPKQPDDPFLVFSSLMQQFGATCSPKEFYWAVNEAYHACEAKHYDYLHASMFRWLRPIWMRNLAHLPESTGLSVLDIGSGTGLVGDFLNDILGNRVTTLTCLDPSPTMHAQIIQKAKDWTFSTRVLEGHIETMETSEQFDVITANSLLHHVVDLRTFCRLVARKLKPGGFFLTAQDPRAGWAENEILAQRRERVASSKGSIWERCRQRLRRFARTTSSRHLQREVNELLASRGIITCTMDLRSIWAVTDVHVPNQPGAFGHGIDVQRLNLWLDGCELLENYTYQYHGMDWDYLPKEFQRMEQQLWESGDEHGGLVGSVWVRV